MQALLRYGFLIATLAALALMGVLGFFKWQSEAAKSAARPTGAGASAQALFVRAHVVEAAPFAERIEAIGTAQARESVIISASQTEVIARVLFESGQRVSRGQVLLELEGKEEEADLLDARAALEIARLDAERFADLAKRGIAPQQRAEETRAVYERAKARIDAINARQADRVIRAPFTGVIGLRDTSPGTVARPGDSLATLDDVSAILVDFPLPERFLGVISKGLNLVARSEAYPDVRFVGSIAQVDSRIDSVTRTFQARAVFDNADGRLRPGMLLLVTVERNRRDALAAPESAIALEGDRAFVFALRNNEAGGVSAEKRYVRLGVRYDGSVEVLDGLAPGDKIVAHGLNRVSPNQTVQIMDEADKGAAVPLAGAQTARRGS